MHALASSRNGSRQLWRRREPGPKAAVLRDGRVRPQEWGRTSESEALLNTGMGQTDGTGKSRAVHARPTASPDRRGSAKTEGGGVLPPELERDGYWVLFVGYNSPRHGFSRLQGRIRSCRRSYRMEGRRRGGWMRVAVLCLLFGLWSFISHAGAEMSEMFYDLGN
jgi:hypothetical protein